MFRAATFGIMVGSFSCVLAPTGSEPVSAEEEVVNPEETLSKNDYDFNVHINGEAPGLDEIVKGTNLYKNLKSPPQHFYQIAEWADQDVENIKNYLFLKGFFESKVSYEIYDNVVPHQVNVRIFLGTRFKVAKLKVVEGEKEYTDQLDKINIKVGEYFEAEAFNEAPAILTQRYKNIGYPFAVVKPAPPVADHYSDTVEITYPAEIGEKKNFGTPIFTGLERVRETLPRSFVRWQQGELYSLEQALKVRDELMKTGLFQSILVQPKQSPANKDEVDVEYTITEEPNKEIGGSLNIRYSDQAVQFGGALDWQHKNVFGSGERFAIGVEASNSSGMIESDLKVPVYNSRLVNDIGINLRLLDERSLPYTKRGFSAELSATKKWLHAGVNVGLAYEHFKSSSAIYSVQDYFTFYSLPIDAYVTFSSQGAGLGGFFSDMATYMYLRLSTKPHVGAIQSNKFFWQNEANLFASVPIISDLCSLAFRSRFGAIFNIDRDLLPPPKRFFMGGGDSLRGYAYTQAGPRADNAQKTPIGGNSVFEAGLEARFKVTNFIGINVFGDTGALSETVNPFKHVKKADDLWWTAGAGVSFHTDFGPLRLDLAYPLNYKHVDSKKWYQKLQLYIRFGNSF